jgi:putative DNA methylase
VPKSQELVATPYRFGGDKAAARRYFETGLSQAFAHMRAAQHPHYPLTVFYAFKQTEADTATDDAGETSRQDTRPLASTGWEALLEGLIQAGFAITGTWPIRTELVNRSVALGTNALASSIVLVCRPQPANAPAASRREFLQALNHELPAALKDLQQGSIAPVDLAQAAIGPGMAVFSRYRQVLEADGSPLRVRTALQLINQTLDAVLAEQEGAFDAETRWAITWFEQFGLEEGPYGVAETLSKAKNTTIERLGAAGILSARAGKVRLLRHDELSDDGNPAHPPPLTVWAVTQRLLHALDQAGERGGAAAILQQVGELGELARDLAYRLYLTCERNGWAQAARAYNSLVQVWPEIVRQAGSLPVKQETMF